MYNGKKVSVVIPAYNEGEGIKGVVKEFSKKYVDEVIVVDNNSTDKTNKLAKKAGAKVVFEKNQGYGFAIQRGLREAKGDLIILTEADSTFVGDDMEKLLAYSRDADMVLGTRVTRELLGPGAKMNAFLLYGNIFIAKLIQLRFWGRTRLTDVGCTFRLIKKRSLRKIQKQFTVGSSHFSPEMMILALKNGLRTVEIPVHYNRRVGQSKITSDYRKSFVLGLKMIWLVLTR